MFQNQQYIVTTITLPPIITLLAQYIFAPTASFVLFLANILQIYYIFICYRSNKTALRPIY